VGQRLGRGEVERDRPVVDQQPLDGRQLVGEALAGGRPGRDHQVLAGPGPLQHLGLVGPQLLDAQEFQPGLERGRQIVRDGHRARRAGRQAFEVDEPARFQRDLVLHVEVVGCRWVGTVAGEQFEYVARVRRLAPGPGRARYP